MFRAEFGGEVILLQLEGGKVTEYLNGELEKSNLAYSAAAGQLSPPR